MIQHAQTFLEAMIAPAASMLIMLEILNHKEELVERIQTRVVRRDDPTDKRGRVFDGSISVDKDQDVRRQFSLVLDNTEGRYTWRPGGLIWLDKRIKLYTGFKTSAGIEYVPQGVFLLSSPVATSRPGVNEARLQGGDKWKLLDGQPQGKLKTTLTIAKDVPIDQAIRTLLKKVNIPDSQIALETCAVTVPYTLTWNEGEAIGKAINDLAALALYEVFFDVNGIFRFQPMTLDMTTVAPCWSYDKSKYTLYAGAEKMLDEAKLFNAVRVIGGSSQTFTVSSYRADTDPNSPTRVELIGERLYQYNGGSPDALITTQTLADNRAEWELRKCVQIVEQQRVTLFPNLLHEAGDVVELVDDGTDTDDRYEILRFNLPFKPGDMMTAEVWRTRKVA